MDSYNKCKAVGTYAAAIFTAAIMVLSAFTIAATTATAFAIPSGTEVQSIESGLMTVNSGPAPSISALNLPEGYTIEPVIWNLTLPSAVTFDGNGTMYIAESGFVYGGFTPTPKILKVDQNGNISTFVDRMLQAPITDIEFNREDGLIYVSHRGTISTIDSDGIVKDIITGLPIPDIAVHHNNQIAFGDDGKLYVGIGSLTNNGVMSPNLKDLGMKNNPDMHDIPAQNITLTGQNFESDNPLTPDPTDNATTGAFVPFGNSTEEDQVIEGDVNCTACLIRANTDGTEVEVVAWGLRNPYGLAFNDEGRLFASINGMDDKIMDNRPIDNDSDKFVEVPLGSDELPFFGWPDFAGDAEPVTDEKFKPERGPQPQFLIQNHPGVEKPLVLIGVAVGSTQVDFASSNFGEQSGMAFVGEIGNMAPITHLPESVIPEGEPEKVGGKVIAVDPETGNFTDFVSLNSNDISFRPVGIAFNEEENALYIASIGKFHIRMTAPNGASLPEPTPWGYLFTGVIWKITSETGAAETGTATVDNQTSVSNATEMTSNDTTTLDLPGFSPGIPESDSNQTDMDNDETAVRESDDEDNE
jgi:glucose/arabinose dehydrogenase